MIDLLGLTFLGVKRGKKARKRVVKEKFFGKSASVKLLRRVLRAKKSQNHAFLCKMYIEWLKLG